jgi:glycosyltransferase involved in cell wall biosynthesis
MSEADLFGVIKNCHAFVMPSYGEAWCYPALEAMTFGIPPIYTKGIGIEDFDSSGFFVDSRVTPCYGANDTFDFLYTSDDFWLEIDIMDLQKKLRQVYELQANPKEFNSLKEICTMRAKQFHFTNTEITRGII